AAADGVMYQLTIGPAIKAQTAKDYPAAEAAWTKALTDYPDKSMIAYNLGIVLRAQKKNDQALYEFARAAAQDPTLGGTQNAQTITNFVKSYYTNYHGSADGL